MRKIYKLIFFEETEQPKIGEIVRQNIKITFTTEYNSQIIIRTE